MTFTPRHPVFYNIEARPKRRQEMVDELVRRHPDEFPIPEHAQRLLVHVFAPASRRWVYAGNGKTGTSSTKRFLFELEFGVPLTVHLEADHDINPDAQSHMLARAGVFRPLIAMPDGLATMDKALRLTTARHPVARALSSFRYLCLSDRLKHVWLIHDRMRMNAVVGFDWRRDPDTPDGFRKFLDYARFVQAQAGTLLPDPHWCCQVDNIRPAVFKPDLVGRTERLDSFFREIAERLGSPLPTGWTAPRANQQSYDEAYFETLVEGDTRRLIGEVFARDFDWLNESPDSWQP